MLAPPHPNPSPARGEGERPKAKTLDPRSGSGMTDSKFSSPLMGEDEGEGANGAAAPEPPHRLSRRLVAWLLRLPLKGGSDFQQGSGIRQRGTFTKLSQNAITV